MKRRGKTGKRIGAVLLLLLGVACGRRYTEIAAVYPTYADTVGSWFYSFRISPASAAPVPGCPYFEAVRYVRIRSVLNPFLYRLSETRNLADSVFDGRRADYLSGRGLFCPTIVYEGNRFICKDRIDPRYSNLVATLRVEVGHPLADRVREARLRFCSSPALDAFVCGGDCRCFGHGYKKMAYDAARQRFRHTLDVNLRGDYFWLEVCLCHEDGSYNLLYFPRDVVLRDII